MDGLLWRGFWRVGAFDEEQTHHHSPSVTAVTVGVNWHLGSSKGCQSIGRPINQSNEPACFALLCAGGRVLSFNRFIQP